MPKTWPKLKKPGTPGWKPMKPVRQPKGKRVAPGGPAKRKVRPIRRKAR